MVKYSQVMKLKAEAENLQQNLFNGSWIDKVFTTHKQASHEVLKMRLKIAYQQMVQDVSELEAELRSTQQSFLQEFQQNEGWKSQDIPEIKISTRKTKSYDTLRFLSEAGVTIGELGDAINISRSKLTSAQKKLYDEYITQTKATTTCSWKEK